MTGAIGDDDNHRRSVEIQTMKSSTTKGEKLLAGYVFYGGKGTQSKRGYVSKGNFLHSVPPNLRRKRHSLRRTSPGNNNSLATPKEERQLLLIGEGLLLPRVSYAVPCKVNKVIKTQKSGSGVQVGRLRSLPVPRSSPY